MKKAMMNWAEKMMLAAHKAANRYQAAMQQEKALPLAKKNMLYGRYLKDMDEVL